MLAAQRIIRRVDARIDGVRDMRDTALSLLHLHFDVKKVAAAELGGIRRQSLNNGLDRLSGALAAVTSETPSTDDNVRYARELFRARPINPQDYTKVVGAEPASPKEFTNEELAAYRRAYIEREGARTGKRWRDLVSQRATALRIRDDAARTLMQAGTPNVRIEELLGLSSGHGALIRQGDYNPKPKSKPNDAAGAGAGPPSRAA